MAQLLGLESLLKRRPKDLSGGQRQREWLSYDDSINKLKSAQLGNMGADLLPIDVASYGKKEGVDALHPAVYHLQYPDFVKKCREQGLKLHVWTANIPEHFAMVKEAGADAVITNYPDKARTYMMNRELSWLKFNERVLNEAGKQHDL